MAAIDLLKVRVLVTIEKQDGTVLVDQEITAVMHARDRLTFGVGLTDVEVSV